MTNKADNEELLPSHGHDLCCRNPEPQPPFRVSVTHYPNDLEACILDKTGEAVLWTDHRIIQSVCDYLNTRTRLSDGTARAKAEKLVEDWDDNNDICLLLDHRDDLVDRITALLKGE